MNFRRKKHTLLPFLLLMILAVFPGTAWAVQSHGAPEGLYVHQLAHVFYVAALGYLFWDIRRSTFKSNGWKFIRIFCVMMILWNVVAFVGHFLSFCVDDTWFTDNTNYLQTRLQGPSTADKLWYYFTKLDHLFSVPALFCLYLGMKNIYCSRCDEEEL